MNVCSSYREDMTSFSVPEMEEAVFTDEKQVREERYP